MSAEQLVLTISRRAAHRLWLRGAIEGASQALAWGSSGATLLMAGACAAAYALNSMPLAMVFVGLAAVALVAAFGVTFVGALVRRFDALAGAKALDDELGLKDRFSSALAFEFSENTLARLALAEVQERAQSMDIRAALPLPRPRELLLLPVFSLAIGLLGFALTEYRPPASGPVAAAKSAEEAARERALLERVRRNLERAAEEIGEEAKKSQSEPGQKAAAALNRTAEELAAAKGADRRSALRKIADERRELEKEQRGLNFDEALARAIAFLVRAPQTRPLARRLQAEDYSGALAATRELAKTLPETELTAEDSEKLVAAATGASEVLIPTKLEALGSALAELAAAIRNKDRDALRRALAKLEKGMENIEKMKQGQRLVEKALQALELGKFDLGKGNEENLPHQDLKAPPGQGNKDEGDKSDPLPILPGPMRQGGGQGPGQGEAPQYLGPCSFDCGFEGQCMKCPCRGQEICPKDKKACPCDFCASSQGQGGGKGKGGGKEGGKGGGKGGDKPGWGHDRKPIEPGKRPASDGAEAKKNAIQGLLGKSGEGAIMAVKTANDGSKASAEQREIFQSYRKVEEESLYRERVPLSRRDLVRRYFDAIKPKE